LNPLISTKRGGFIIPYTMGKEFDMPWVGGSGYHKRVSIFHGWGLNIPWVAGQNTLGRGLDIP
jgi:hypothetical protein